MDESEEKLSKLAVLSLVLGISSLFFFVLAGIPAIVIGIISTLRIRRSAGKLKGKYIALAGMSLRQGEHRRANLRSYVRTTDDKSPKRSRLLFLPCKYHAQSVYLLL